MFVYFYVLFAIALLAFGFVLQRLYQDRSANGSAAARFSMTSGIFSVVIMLAMNGFAPEFSLYSLINAFLKSFSCFAYTILGFRIMKRGKMVLYTLFLMSGGMLLPSVWGWCFQGDPILPQRVIGTAVILISIMISNLKTEKSDLRTVLACICVFFLNGCVSILSKMHQINTVYDTVSTTGYALYFAVFTFAMSLICCAITKKSEGAAAKPKSDVKNYPWILIGIVAVYSMTGTLSSLLQLESAKTLPASVLYPMITGGSVVLSGLFSMLFFKTRPAKKEWVGIALCFVGTLLFL